MLSTIAIACLPLAGQTPCGSPGPDLVVGDLHQIGNFASSGGIEACSFGIIPCNVGSVWIDCFASTPRHPVYGQSLYRLKTVDGSTRFEELGQNWLRHGFFALSGSQCCACTPTDGTHLGVGCADSLSAVMNASQSGLGPRWQVDAATGGFEFPPANPPVSKSIDRRLQVAIADLEPTGAGTARYFGEAHAVAPDDAAAGNKDNNSSHREVLVTGSGTAWDFLLTGSTQTQLPALYAWQEADPAVVVNEVQVAGDGRFLLASRATDLGGGTWHYEYALHNQNSDRSARAFRVPFPSGEGFSNAGFHDVAYHSGDGPGDVNFDGTDWAVASAPGELVFSTQTYAANPSANALRWSTTYNFRFDSGVPPGDASVTIELFKPGFPDSVTVPAVVPFLVPEPPRSFCFGDGVRAACPCGNSGLPLRGCENSVGTGGAVLSASGNPSLSADGVGLTSTAELPSALSLVLQGDFEIAPVSFGDGVRCAGGTLKRLYAKSASGGSVSVPQAGDPSISARSAALGDPISVGETRIYQVYYRDPNPAWCPAPQGSTFNATSAVEIAWGT